jgi:hypothetical protein
MRDNEFHELVRDHKGAVDALVRDLLKTAEPHVRAMNGRNLSIESQVAVVVHAACQLAALQIFVGGDDRQQWDWFVAFDRGVIPSYIFHLLDRHRATWGQAELQEPSRIEPRIIW